MNEAGAEAPQPPARLPREPGPRLVCLGNLTLDDILAPGAPPRPGCIGGDALYGVLAARLFLPDTEMVAPVGHDLPERVWRLIDQAGLSRAGLPARDCPTIHTRFAYETPDRRHVTLLSDPADFDRLSPRAPDIPAAYWHARAFMVLAMTLAAQQDLLPVLRARSTALIALDPQEEYIDGNEAAVLALLPHLDVFLPSLDEVRRLLGHTDIHQAARQFSQRGPRIVVLKCGAQGCLVYDSRTDTSFTLPAHPGPVIDTTGAGDAFCAAFMASLVLNQDDLQQAARRAALAASVAISAFGAGGFLEEKKEGLLF